MTNDDTLVVPAIEAGFQQVFLGEKYWPAVRIAEARLKILKYIAVYRCAPISAITHYALIKEIVPDSQRKGRYKLMFADEAIELKNPIAMKNLLSGAMQSPRYTNFALLTKAACVEDLF